VNMLEEEEAILSLASSKSASSPVGAGRFCQAGAWWTRRQTSGLYEQVSFMNAPLFAIRADTVSTAIAAFTIRFRAPLSRAWVHCFLFVCLAAQTNRKRRRRTGSAAN